MSSFSREQLLHLRRTTMRVWRSWRTAELPYDLILSGSDQIWNPKIFPDGRFDPVFFGTFSRKAAALPTRPPSGSRLIPDGMQAELKGYLDGFSHLSVRERQGQRDCPATSTGRDVPVVLDPTLLLD